MPVTNEILYTQKRTVTMVLIGGCFCYIDKKLWQSPDREQRAGSAGRSSVELRAVATRAPVFARV